MYLGYQPYTVAGAMKPSIRLKAMAGLGEVPVVVVKDEAATASFGQKITSMLPFAVAMVGVSVVSSLAVYAITKLIEGKKGRPERR